MNHFGRLRHTILLAVLFAAFAATTAFTQETREHSQQQIFRPNSRSFQDGGQQGRHDGDEQAEGKMFRPRQFADWRDLPSDIVEQAEVRNAIWKALGELPDIYRVVFVLRDVQHLDVEETAQVLGIGKSAVKTRLHRAQLMMRESLTPMFAKPKGSIWDRWKGMNPWLAAKR
jgi:RNA polymerase sigma factor (sigma-70 family)